MLRTLIQVVALFFTAESAFFLARGNLGLSADVIARLASTYFGSNPEVVGSLSEQKADTWIGVVLLLAAFMLQMVNLLWPFRWSDFQVSWSGAWLGVLICCASLALGIWASDRIATTTKANVEKVLTPPASKGQSAK